MVLKNRRVKITLFAFWGFCVGVLLYLYHSQLQEGSYHCGGGGSFETVIKSKHPIAAGTQLTGDMVRLEKVSHRFSHPQALVARNVHTYMDLTIRIDIEEGEILALDHVYEPYLPPPPAHRSY